MSRKTTDPLPQSRPRSLCHVNLSDTTKAGVLFIIGLVAWLYPVSIFDVEIDGIPNERMEWRCERPITNLGTSVSEDDIRADLESLPAEEKLASIHPDCGGMAWAQTALGGAFIAISLFLFWRVWKAGAEARAEKKFKKLHAEAGKPRDKLL